jgi:hypothetical protein
VHSSTKQLLAEGRDLSFHLVEEAERALGSWAVLEANRLSHEPWRRSFHLVQFRNLDIGEAHHQIVGASLRDALSTLGRMTDPPRDGNLTLFRIAEILALKDVKEDLLDVIGRSCAPDKEQSLVQADLNFLSKHLQRFDPSLKGKGQIRRPYSLMMFRAELHPFRNHLFAHARNKTNLGGIWLDQFRMMLTLTAWITQKSLFVFNGTRWDAKKQFAHYLRSHRELIRSLSIEFIDHSAGPLARKIWERNRVCFEQRQRRA